MGPARPGHADQLQQPQHIGKTYIFRVTGVGQGLLWGTGVYTLDSTLAVAAVHAGCAEGRANGEREGDDPRPDRSASSARRETGLPVRITRITRGRTRSTRSDAKSPRAELKRKRRPAVVAFALRFRLRWPSPACRIRV